MLQQLASIFNLTGLTVVLLGSLMVLNSYSSPFFLQWTRAFAAAMAMTAVEVAAPLVGRPPAIQFFEVALCLLAAWFYVQTGRTLLERSLPNRLFGWVLGTGLLVAFFMIASGMDFALVSAPPLLVLSGCIAYLAFVLVRQARSAMNTFNSLWLGYPLLLLGFLPLLFPLIVDTSIFWTGYWLSGILHLITGVGMMMYVVEGAASQLRLQNQELKDLDRMKNDFLGMVSHELRTPLTVIKAASAMVKEKRMAQKDEDLLIGSICHHADHLNHLISDLLDVSRLEFGKFTYQKQEVDLNELLRTAAFPFFTAGESKGVALALELDGEDLRVLADECRLQQVLSNLLSNSLKFTDHGGRITIRAGRHSDTARVEVVDTGVGIPDHHHAQIFKQFFQVDGGETRAAGGMGLGLAICKAIIEEGHGGRLWVESTPGLGSSFIFTIPLDGDSRDGAREKLQKEHFDT